MAIEAADKADKAQGAAADPDWQDLRQAISQVTGIVADQIVCAAGMGDLVSALVRLHVDPGQVVLGSCFGTSHAAEACAQVQGMFVAAQEPGHTVSVQHMLHAVTPQTRIVLLSNPGPHTGTFIAGSKLIELRGHLPAEVLLVVDQAQGEFGDTAQKPSLLYPLVEAGNTVILRDLSGAYGLPGAAVGWGYFPSAIANEMRQKITPGDISAADQAMAVAAMQDQAHMQRNVRLIREVRDGFSRDMRKIGVVVPPSYADFVSLQFASDQVARGVEQMLQARGMSVPRSEVAGLTHSLRALIGTPEQMGRILSALSPPS